YSKSNYCKDRLGKFKNISNKEWIIIGNNAIKKKAQKAASIAYEYAGENEIAAVVKSSPNMPDVYFSLAEHYINKRNFKKVKRYLHEIEKSKHKKSNILLSSFICKQISYIEKKKSYYLSDNNELLKLYTEILALGKEFKITFSQDEIEKMKEIKYKNYKNIITGKIDEIKRNDLLNDDIYFLRELTEYLNEWQYEIVNSSKPNKNFAILPPNKSSSPEKSKKSTIKSNGSSIFRIESTNNQLNIYCKNDKNAKTINLIKIAPGKVFLGKNNDIFNKEQEFINLNYNYWIGKYPITNEQFSLYKKDHIFDIGDRLKPVVNISWKTALMYCDWLQNEVNIDNEKKFIIRLPNEAEWERAAKGETTNIYPWGNDPASDEVCNYGRNNRGLTKIGKYSPKGESYPFGCCDMAGNVWEWTISLYSDKKIDNSGNNFSRKIIRGNRYVCKGGAWNFPKQYVTCSSRYKFLPNTVKNNIGYRILIIRY
ncbi:MAG: formylglycine-generating enzyme family protein, partial [Candidatus Electrothrix sp. MAN1_4]|nr:formylglycine-generating enzyme family protein [Candidatus Electrothrix sp. MAN1_4]